MRQHWPAATAIALVVTSAGVARGQTPPTTRALSWCASEEAGAHDLSYIRELAGSTSSDAEADRAKYRLVATPADSVVLIQDATTCHRAAHAYGAIAGDGPQPRGERRMIVIQVRDRYVVTDEVAPIRAGEFRSTIVFDSAWQFLVGIDS